MKKMSKVEFIKNKKMLLKEIPKIIALGKKYDKEKDPEAKAALKEEIIQKCNFVKGKVNLTNCTPEEEEQLLGFSVVDLLGENDGGILEAEIEDAKSYAANEASTEVE